MMPTCPVRETSPIILGGVQGSAHIQEGYNVLTKICDRYHVEHDANGGGRWIMIPCSSRTLLADSRLYLDVHAEQVSLNRPIDQYRNPSLTITAIQNDRLVRTMLQVKMVHNSH